MPMHDEIVAILENRPLTGGHYLLSLDAPRQASAMRPGQFAMLRILGRSDVLLRRPMSIFNVIAGNGRHGKGPQPAQSKSRPGQSPRILQLLYKSVGRGTRILAELKKGDKVGLLAPLGHGFFEEEYLSRAREADEILHVAGGIGIAALLLPAKRLAEMEFKQRLFFGARTRADLVGTAEFKPLVKSTSLATENGSAGYHGYVTQPLEQYLDAHSNKKFLLLACGPSPMLRATVQLANRFAQPCLVSMENRMGCGVGACLGCCVRVIGEGHEAYQRVCTEGPVFWAEKIVWQ
jgi:dihydroorotate dehydrogenase electron transfer subunit